VAFWQLPAGAVAPRRLARLRRARIRLRWILDEAWLLAAGARAERFGAAASGVLDPDDRQAVRRWLARPIEVLVAVPLLAVTGLLAFARRRGLDQGRLRTDRVEVDDERGDTVTVSVFREASGQPLPLWWQSGLLLALLRGRIGLVGPPLGALPATERPDAVLRQGSAAPGLTGGWAAAHATVPAWRRSLHVFWFDPGGLATPVEDGVMASRSRGEEVEVP
jgi:hypothetical protein